MRVTDALARRTVGSGCFCLLCAHPRVRLDRWAESMAAQSATRKRAGTVSAHPPPTSALKAGSLKTVTLWVQESGLPVDVVLNPDCWPGVTNGDLILVTNANRHAETSGYLFQYCVDVHTRPGAVGVCFATAFSMLKYVNLYIRSSCPKPLRALLGSPAARKLS